MDSGARGPALRNSAQHRQVSPTLAQPPHARYHAPMSDTPPDRLSTNEDSPYYDAAALERGVGIRFKGVEKTNIEEYCVSEGWVRVSVGNTKDRRGNPLTLKLAGDVVPYFKDVAS